MDPLNSGYLLFIREMSPANNRETAATTRGMAAFGMTVDSAWSVISGLVSGVVTMTVVSVIAVIPGHGSGTYLIKISRCAKPKAAPRIEESKKATKRSEFRKPMRGKGFEP
jgi:hypothetical protein